MKHIDIGLKLGTWWLTSSGFTHLPFLDWELSSSMNPWWESRKEPTQPTKDRGCPENLERERTHDLGPHSSGELWSSRWNNSWTFLFLISLSLSLNTLHRFLWKDWCSSTCYDVAQFTLQIKTRSERLERLQRLVSEESDCPWPGIIFKCLGVAMTSCLGFVRKLVTNNFHGCLQSTLFSFVGGFGHISWGYRDQKSKPLLWPYDWVNF